LLTWARSQRNLIEYHSTELKIINLVEHCIKVLDETAKNKSITLSHEIDPDLSAYCDENTILTVIRNLISNALKFTDIGGSITIGGSSIEGFIQISVADTGIGMSETNLKKLFKQDQIFTKPGTKGEKGTGLGLLLCKDFVEGNGGKIRVESEIGKGTTFYFTLPSIK
jgi:signal transduction histidine kinase